jgi:hypothetical protein
MRRAKTALAIAILAASAIAAAARERGGPTRHELRHIKGVNKAVIGIVERMSGPSFLLRGGKSAGGGTGISLGMRLFETDRIRTGAIDGTDRSRLHVRFKDGTYVEVGEESSFEAERIRFKPPNPLPVAKRSDQFDETVFRFLYGLVRITAPDIHALEYFTVKTANAIIRVTGPAELYIIQLVNDRDLTVRVARGKVEVMNAVTNETMSVPEGTAAYVRVSGLVTNAGPFTQEQIDFLKSRTRI